MSLSSQLTQPLFQGGALLHKQKAAEAARKSLDIVRAQLRVGQVFSASVLSAEATHEQAVQALVQARAARYADTVALFQSLGGGWWNRRD